MNTGCFRCGATSHWIADCSLADRATSFTDHMARITGYIDRWAEGQLSTEQKRTFIGAENLSWYGINCPPKLRYP
jgi:hypothetical protein